MQTEIQDEVVWRLNTTAGHLHAIQEMVNAGRPCEEVINQLIAVKAALRVVETRLLAYQVMRSAEIILNGSKEARIAELARLYDLYVLLLTSCQNPNRLPLTPTIE